MEHTCKIHNQPMVHRQGMSKAGKLYDFWGCSIKENEKFCPYTENGDPIKTPSAQILDKLDLIESRLEDIYRLVENR